MCTGIQLKTKKGDVVYARTMEFGQELGSQVLVIPPLHPFTALGINGKSGKTWQSKYAITGANVFGQVAIADGINSEGLAVGLFYFAGFAGYMDVPATDIAHSISSTDVSTWLLSNCKNVAEVKNAVLGLKINNGVPPGVGLGPNRDQPHPLHYNVHDKQGNALVIECIGGVIKTYDNPVGVLTNSPTFDWHIINLSNYINLSPVNSDTSYKFNDKNIAALGQGSGFLGLPGDFTPPSRFIRAVAFSQSAIPTDKPEDAIYQAFHVLNSFDIPKGIVRQVDSTAGILLETTLWTAASDLTNKRFYFHTINDRTIRMVDLGSWKFVGTDIVRLGMDAPQEVEVLKTGFLEKKVSHLIG